MKERNILILKLVSTHLLIFPLLILACIIFNGEAYSLISISISFLLILTLAGYWEFFGLTFRTIYIIFSLIVLMAVLAIKLLFFHIHDQNLFLNVFLAVLQIYLLVEITRIFVVIMKTDIDAVEIEFPFKNGRYMITDGGNSRISRLMNYHYFSRVHMKNKTNNSMLYATDIIKLSDSGSVFFPPENTDYPIFGEQVFSPLSGIVVKAENNIPDNIPYSGNYPYNTGNTIVIKNENRYLLLGHLKKDSIKVRTGEMVRAGDLLAEAGNSGYSERPHIHIQLIDSKTDNYWKGKGINIRFMNKNLYKNRIIEI